MRQALAYVLNAALAIIALGLLVALSACTPKTLIVPMEFANSFQAGAVVCSTTNVPVIFVDSKRLNDPRMKFVIAHERHHVLQTTRLSGGCREMQEKYARDADFGLSQEIEAYEVDCKLMVRADTSLNREKMLDNLAVALAQIYPFGKSAKEIRKHLKC